MAYVWYGTAIATVCGLGMVVTGSLKPLSIKLPTRPAAEAVSVKTGPAQSVDKRSVLQRSTQAAAQSLDSSSSQNADLALYQAADAFAQQASAAAAKAGVATDSLVRAQAVRQSRVYWQQALKKLNEIPTDSPLFERATTKQKNYQKELAVAVRKTAAMQTTLIADTLQDIALDPAQVHITLCQLTDPAEPLIAGELNPQICKHHQGAQPLASPASLIKLPIALALIEKTSRENIPLTTRILIDSSNYTENAEGVSLEVGKEYSLQEVMSLMIQKSDNIGTNQLIDYLDYASINQALQAYPATSVGHKLVGNETMPANFGGGRNQTTTHDITAMMAHIYGPEGNQSIRTALARQQDRELGHIALQDIGPQVKWLGEKTGQNNLLLGTTLAMTVHQDTYVLTVAIDNSSDVLALQQVINRLARQLSLNGSFVKD